MMYVVILEGPDAIQPNDWCRPLQIVSSSGGLSDHYSFMSCYTGKPENNAKWVRVKYILGKHWHGKTVAEYTSAMKDFGRMEFIRGEIPRAHRLSMADYSKTDYSKDHVDDINYGDPP